MGSLEGRGGEGEGREEGQRGRGGGREGERKGGREGGKEGRKEREREGTKDQGSNKFKMSRRGMCSALRQVAKAFHTACSRKSHEYSYT